MTPWRWASYPLQLNWVDPDSLIGHWPVSTGLLPNGLSVYSALTRKPSITVVASINVSEPPHLSLTGTAKVPFSFLAPAQVASATERREGPARPSRRAPLIVWCRVTLPDIISRKTQARVH